MTSRFPTFAFQLNWFLHIIKKTLHVGSKIWILCSRGKNNISRVSAANEWDILLATRNNILYIFGAPYDQRYSPESFRFKLPLILVTLMWERMARFPSVGTELLNLASRVRSKVYEQPMSTSLLLLYKSSSQSLQTSLLTTMFGHAHYYLSPERISLKSVID